MTHAEDFCRDYQGVLDGLDLPLRISLSYEPVSLLAERDGRSVWKLRRRCDGAPFVLKVSSGEEEELEVELRLLTRLYPALAGAVPLAADCFAQGGRCFLVRSYLPGRTLAQLREEAGGCTEAQCVSIGRQACALLERLRTLEPPVIHRDIKPENIVLGEDGTLGLIDFGIARQYKPERDADTRLMGSRSTAPPEQYGFAQTDGRADLYALGITLIWLLTGSYEREALEKAPVSRRLKRVLAKATAFSPAGRYPTAAALGRALRGSGAGRGLRIALAAAACAALCLGLGPCLSTRAPKSRRSPLPVWRRPSGRSWTCRTGRLPTPIWSGWSGWPWWGRSCWARGRSTAIFSRAWWTGRAGPMSPGATCPTCPCSPTCPT